MLEKLIELVKMYNVLYNTKSKYYENQNIRNSAWEIIADKLGMPVHKVKETWTKLQNSYANVLMRRRNKCAEVDDLCIPGKYEKQLEFLNPYIEPGLGQVNTNSNLLYPASSSPTPSLNIENTDADYSSANESQDKCKEDSFSDILPMLSSTDLKIQHSQLEIDEIDHFFLSMSKSLKKLSRIDQSRIKFNLHKAIHDAEMLLLQQTDVSISDEPSRCAEVYVVKLENP